MSFRLPPLKTLRFFEAAAHLRSFKAVAEEMHVTPSAVSHSVRSLEEWLGVDLFHRTRQGLVLTEAGSKYYPIVREALDKLRAATADATGKRGRRSLSISAAPTFARSWLLPRLTRFRSEFPDVAVSIDTSRQQVDLPREDVDLVIRMATGPRPSGTWLRLAREELIPVCSLDLAQEIAGMPWPEVLVSCPLIHVTTVTEDWSRYFREVLPEKAAATNSFRFDTIHMAIQAARQGLGVALGRRPIIDEELDAGRLVSFGAPSLQAATCYWLVGAETTFDRPEARAFRKWLLREIEFFRVSMNSVDPPPGEKAEADAPAS